MLLSLCIKLIQLCKQQDTLLDLEKMLSPYMYNVF